MVLSSLPVVSTSTRPTPEPDDATDKFPTPAAVGGADGGRKSSNPSPPLMTNVQPDCGCESAAETGGDDDDDGCCDVDPAEAAASAAAAALVGGVGGRCRAEVIPADGGSNG